jgi:hypothetical protein
MVRKKVLELRGDLLYILCMMREILLFNMQETAQIELPQTAGATCLPPGEALFAELAGAGLKRHYEPSIDVEVAGFICSSAATRCISSALRWRPVRL